MPLNVAKFPTDEELEKLATQGPTKDGTYSGVIRGSHETESKRSGRLMIRSTAAFLDDEGNEREIAFYLHTANAALKLLLHTARACGVEAKLKAGSISAEDIQGPARFVVGTEPKRGRFAARNVILDVLPPETTSVVLRAAE